MKSHARVVVIGGGVVGVSTLYHLTLKGWSDVMLLERRELASGSTWHAAGLLPLFNMSYSVGQIHKYSVRLYTALQEKDGHELGLRRVSNIRLATTPDRMDEYRQYAGVAETIGVKVEFLTPEEVIDIWPLAVSDGLIGAIRHPDDGYIQPSDLTQTFARLARAGGAEINRGVTVKAIERSASGEWTIITDAGEVTCEHVVSASGNFARQTGRMVGLDIPVIPVEHQYIVTEPHPDIQARHERGEPEMGVLRESDGSWYMREEAGGLLLGPYEKGAPACYVDGPDPDAEYELFQDDIERLEPHIESAINRVPAFGEAGIKQIYNGAIAYTPDGSPIIGPAWDVPNFWLNEGHSFGITAAGGAGWQLAEWIVEGAPTIDMLGVDPRRFGPYATRNYLIRKNEEAYENVFTTHYPDEERPAGRPLKTAPCYDRMKALGAVFHARYGWERPNWFAPEGVEQKDHWSFRRSKWFEHARNEAQNVMKNVGLLDLTAFAKARISGPGACEFLDRLVANKVPTKDGRIALCHALNQHGGVHSEFTLHKEADHCYYAVSAGVYTRIDHDWVRKHMPDDGSVRFDDLSTQLGTLVVAGPNSRELLERVSADDFSNEAFPWLTGRDVIIGMAPVKALRVNFIGELGWELHHPIEMQNHVFDALMEAGAELGIRPFGIRAMEGMRIEKTYRMPGHELSIEYAALESGLDRFIKLDKGDFIGRDALIKWKERGFDNQLVMLEVHDVEDADPVGNNPIYKDGELVGRATTGGYGYRLDQSYAIAMVRPSLAGVGTELEMDILGNRHRVTIIPESPYDPENRKLRDV
ncbi:MAG: GcvT family protein [Pseudomonadota bacterium]|nr:MAG: GcvT family protein [Pseudomonadota bacterium]